MKIATWNVNSLKVRLPQLLGWMAAERPDVLCLQETKCEDGAFPKLELEAAGYRSVFCGQKTYNGVAILARDSLALDDVIFGNPVLGDEQKRLVSARCGDVRVICAYIPNGQSVGSDKYAYKLRWMEALQTWLADELKRYPQLVLAGDFNVAPEERDVHDPKAWEGQVLFSEPERAAFQGLVQLGLKDAFRLFPQPQKIYSWWDYRMLAFRRNTGLRIDHVLVSDALVPYCRSCVIDKEPRRAERPSDHAPVVAELDLPVSTLPVPAGGTTAA